MITVAELSKHYLQVLEISPQEAKTNAEHILEHVQAVDKNGIGYNAETMKPIVRIVEYIQNEEKTNAFVEYCNTHNREPEWAADEDFGLKGFMLPYLSEMPKEVTPVRAYYAIVENSEYYNEDKKPAILISEIDMISDKSFS